MKGRTAHSQAVAASLSSKVSGKSYRVALRGEEHGDSFCTCPDFRSNTLGTCKHILHSLRKVRRRFPKSAFEEPYQLDGIAFAAGAGRAILADEMGLGKTIQAIGVAELLAREAGIRRVLVVCPTSLKSQWRNEVERFSDRDCQLVVGRADERPEQYRSDAFFTAQR